jgi:hypothetical protein
MGENIYRLKAEEIKTIRLLFKDESARELPISMAANHEEVMDREDDKQLRQLAKAIQHFSSKATNPSIEFVIKLAE